MPDSTVWIHADESCLGNQFMGRANPGGAGGLIERWSDSGWIRSDYWTSDSDTTNNRMALMSALVALGELERGSRVRFVSDSQYLVKGAQEWMPGWKRRGWKRRTGAVENVDLWKRLDVALARHEVRWSWVRGHAGHPRNEYANHLATSAAERQDDSGGLVSSSFLEWLADERERHDRYLGFDETAPPEVPRSR